MADSRFDLIAGALSLDFCNTVEGRGTEGETDLFGSFRDLAEWSREAGSLPEETLSGLLRLVEKDPHAGDRVLRRARKFRAVLHSLFSTLAAEEEPPSHALQALNRELKRSLPHRAMESQDGRIRWRWQVGDRPEAVLWPVVWSAADLLASDRRPHVGCCAQGDCTWLFLDRSRNRSRRWCSDESCGNRARVKRHYHRSRGS
jgi:predicted RNA-binding Zn ribbon-like protein